MSAAAPVAVERHHTATAFVTAGERTLLLWHAALAMWLPPGGHLEPNETPAEAAIREAEEESGLRVCVVPPRDLAVFTEVAVVPPPAVILVEDIVRADQPFHQHIDHVYFTQAPSPVDFAAPIPHGPHRWVTSGELEAGLSLETPGVALSVVSEDVRLLGIRAIEAARRGHA